MLSYSLNVKKVAECINPKVSKTYNRKIISLSKCAVCNSKKQILLKNKK